MFGTLTDKFKSQYNETGLSMQYSKLHRKDDETSEDWVCRLKVMAANCKYKKKDRHLKEQFINGLNNNGMVVEII